MEHKHRILVADDNQVILRILQRLLEQEGYEVLLAQDGAEAIQSVRANEPDVVLLDLEMPHMDGHEITKALKEDESTLHIPVVILTGHGDPDNRISALEHGADDFIAKPPPIPELKARLRSLVKVKAYNDHIRNYQRQLKEEVDRRTAELQRAMDELEETHRNLKQASLETIYRLSRAAEFKDQQTAAHIQRMSRYAAAVAERLGLEAEHVDRILYATPMHDVGKIGIPDRILMKPGPLTPHEWQTMKQHTLYGAQILGGSTNPLVQAGELIALTHHERWDGTGYPRGLTGDDIPLEGRIAAVADVFDALTSKRPYKEAFPVYHAIRQITDATETQFDPEVIDAFMKARNDILDIMRELSDENTTSLVAEWQTA